MRAGEISLDGRQHRIVGANLWQAARWGAADSNGDRPRLLRELDRLRAVGVKAVRILLASEAGDSASEAETECGVAVGRLWPPMRRGPLAYDDDLLAALEFAVAEIGARGLRAILTLGNMWQWSGGFASPLHWATGEPIPRIAPAASADGQWQDHQDLVQIAKIG